LRINILKTINYLFLYGTGGRALLPLFLYGYFMAGAEQFAVGYCPMNYAYFLAVMLFVSGKRSAAIHRIY
jgi:hypothetical protein